MVLRTSLVGLRLAPLADPTATGDVPLVVMPDGTIRRKQPSLQEVTFTAGYKTWTVPAGVTSIDYVVQAAGGGGGGTHELYGVGLPGADTAITSIGVGVVDIRAKGGGGAARWAPGAAGTGGIGGTGHDGYPGASSGNGTGGNAGISRVTAGRGLGATRTSAATEGGGGAGGGTTTAYGGGGGECRVGTITVTPGQELTLNVGLGGTAGLSISAPVSTPGADGFVTLRYVGV